AFSRESLDPRPGPGGKPRGRVYPATVPTEPPTNDRGPRPSFSPFLGRNGDPRRVGGHRGAAPRGRAKPRPPVGYVVPEVPTGRPPGHWPRRGHLSTAGTARPALPGVAQAAGS